MKFDSKNRSISGKQLLALDAMAKLANQFSKNPDFDKLISTLILTLSGQFTVSDLFAIIHKPGHAVVKSEYYAFGKYKSNASLRQIGLTNNLKEYFLRYNSGGFVGALETTNYDADFKRFMKQEHVEIVCPIIHGDNLIGLIGIGRRITRKEFVQKDVDLMSTFISTITPLIASSYHYWEMSQISSWYLDILNSVSQGVFVFNDKFELLNINNAGQDILNTFTPGLKSEGALAQQTPILDVFQENIFPDWAERIAEDFSGTESIEFNDMVAGTGDIRREYDITVSKILSDTGFGENLIITLDDITERKRAENQEKELNTKLERSQRMESIGILAGGVAHDLNNMLGPLVGYPELILMKLSEDDPLRKQVKLIGQSAREAAEVIQDLLTLARRGRYEMITTDLNEMVMNFLQSPTFLKLKENQGNVDVKIKLGQNIKNIKGSSAHLFKVVMNLIVNAFDAMPKGGTLTVETSQESRQNVPGGYNNIDQLDYIVLRVGDTGMGIAMEDIDRIFEPYYSKKKMGSSGSGLGLSVVYGIVKDHRGFYDIESKIDKGTVFSIYFPAVTDQKESEKKEKDYSGTERVMVVDDVDEIRELAASLLSSNGYDVKTAGNGHEALDYLKNDLPDIIILDMIMEKGFDGLDTYREILKLNGSQKVVVISGYSVTDRVREMQELGAGQYVKKPFTRNSLCRAVREELDKAD